MSLSAALEFGFASARAKSRFGKSFRPITKFEPTNPHPSVLATFPLPEKLLEENAAFLFPVEEPVKGTERRNSSVLG